MVVQTTETYLSYYGDVYEPAPDSNYKTLFEFPYDKLSWLQDEVGIDRYSYGLDTPVQSQALKDRVLKYWKESK